MAPAYHLLDLLQIVRQDSVVVLTVQYHRIAVVESECFETVKILQKRKVLKRVQYRSFLERYVLGSVVEESLMFDKQRVIRVFGGALKFSLCYSVYRLSIEGFEHA